ncbi:hypothetical protein FS837_013057 [Tulasnella sp. UAMH 9824]|nr:hypothetical protein FS837_013057 [Tulasnella sp. UAMH 9824]
MARKLAALPPIATGLPERPLMSMNEKHLQVDASSPSSSSGSCHNMLPCIMITPSSPTHEYDYEVHYFEAPEPQPSRSCGFFSSIRKAFCPSSSCTSRGDAPAIALPDSPSVSQYGYTSSTDRSWSASRRFRMILALAVVLFFSLHLIALPKMDHGMYEVFSTDHSHDGELHDAVTSWETVSEWQPAPPAAREAAHAKPVDAAQPAHPASSLD